MEKVADVLVKKMLSHSLIDSADTKIYAYGIKNLIYIGINFLWAVCLAVYFGKYIEILVFICTFMILRSYAGGLHCRKKFCFLLSNIIIILPIFIEIKNSFTVLVCILISMAEIAFLSPMENQNKILSQDEAIRYKKNVYKILIICLGLIIIMLNLRCFPIYSSIGLAILMVCLLQILNVLKKAIEKLR